MPSPEDQPDILLPPVTPTALPARVEDKEHQVWVQKSESGVLFVRVARGERLLFSASVSEQADVQLLFADGRQVIFPAKTETTPDAPTLKPETEKPVRLRGRFGLPFRIKDSPTGGTMALSSFAEHPNRAVWSYSNTLAEKPEKDTVWWPVAAFDERVELAGSITISKVEYDITCFPRSWTETGKDGQTRTVNGLYLLEVKPFVRRSKREAAE